MVDNKPLVMFADCTVIYNGRAYSTLERGNYLIIYKPDGSVSIHGADLVMPRNYISSNGKLEVDVVNNRLIFTKKKESVTINLVAIHSVSYLDDWSSHKIVISRTEKELAKKIFDNWFRLFDDVFYDVVMEYPTPLGPIDIAGFTSSTDYIVEVKRRKASLKDVTQLRRYVEALEGRGKLCKAYLAAPSIAKGALSYLEKHELNFLQVDFDIV
jgi:endonuclease